LQQFFFESFKKSFSETRLRPYRINPYGCGCNILSRDSETATLARYLWNIKLCESFYIPLQNLEVCLRNRIDCAVTDFTGNSFWFQDPNLMRKEETKNVSKVIRRLKKEKSFGYIPSEGKIIAELNFGFWSTMFFQYYDESLFRRCLSNIFVNMPKYLKLRKYVYNRLDSLRKFRNRVFHHEPIWKQTEYIPVMHNKILEFIYWIDENVYYLTKQMSSVDSVYVNGVAPYIKMLCDERFKACGG